MKYFYVAVLYLIAFLFIGWTWNNVHPYVTILLSGILTGISLKFIINQLNKQNNKK